MAGMLDTVRDVQQTNHQLLAEISERDATIAMMQAEHERATLAIVSLIKSLNASNVRCSEMQQCMHVVGVEPQPGYFLATLNDGTIVGPFGRN
jgi:hypothetical protein